MPTFEWDPAKSLANIGKHGISFFTALEIWNGLHISVEGIARAVKGETRNATVGLIGKNIFTAIWVWRNEKIRIICVRRARDGEKEAYYQRVVQF